MGENPQKIRVILFCTIISIILNAGLSFFYAVSANAETFTTEPSYDNREINSSIRVNDTIDIASFTVTNAVIGAIPIASAINSLFTFPQPIGFIIAFINVLLSVVTVLFISLLITGMLPFFNA